MQWWMAGVGLAVVLAWSARNLGRAGRTSASGLVTLRAVGSLGLLAMAVEALLTGFPVAASVAALAAAPLMAGLAVDARRARRARTAAHGARRAPARAADQALGRRAA